MRVWKKMGFVAVVGAALLGVACSAPSPSPQTDPDPVNPPSTVSDAGPSPTQSTDANDDIVPVVNPDITGHLARLKQQDAALVDGLKGQLLRVPMPYSSRLHKVITAWVYLPPDYDKSNARYPVAYVLHGAPGGVRDCFVNGRVHRVAEDLILRRQISPLILVGWDGAGPDGVNDVTDFLNRNDGYAMEDFTTHELLPWVDANYRTIPDAHSRALVGFSAGGYGAANLGLKHPDLWRVMASHSGFFDPRDDAENMTKILGPDSPLWDENSPLLRARSLPEDTRLHFYMDVGRDDSLLHEFKKMRDELKARGVDFEAHVFAGAHTWDYLNRHYTDSLKFCDRRWKEMAYNPGPHRL